MMIQRVNNISGFVNDKIRETDLRMNKYDDLVKGKLGLVLYLLNDYKLKGEEAAILKISEIMEDIFDKISQNNSFLAANVTLADGLPGLGVVLNELLKEEIIDPEYRTQIDIIATSCFERAMEMLSARNFDYFYGPTGILFFLNEIHADDYCSLMIDELYRYGKENGFLFYNNSGDSYTRGVNFGFAHGSLSLSAVLLKLYVRGVRTEKTSELVLNITERMLDFKKDRLSPDQVTYQLQGYDYPSWFPYNIISSNEDQKVRSGLYDSNLFHYTDRLGWCNSDLPHVMMLYRIGQTLDQPKYTQYADEIGEGIIHRKHFEDTAIKAANMCHGTGGVSLIYSKIYAMTGKEIYREASEYWLEETISYLEGKMEKPFANHDLELLTGWLGPLLLLNDKCFGRVSQWDSFFLVQ